MNINFQTFSVNSSYKYLGVNSKPYATNAIRNQGLVADTFIKNTTQPSFMGDNQKSSIKDDLICIGLLGAPILLSVGACSYAMNHMEIDHLFAPDGSYIMSLKDKTLESDTINADGETGEFKIEGTNVNIEPDKYDISIPEKGIYKNLDGSIDIDLQNNKYIDTENKIFIDPEHKISAIGDENGLHNVVLPSFSGHSMSEGYARIIPSRSEYIEKYGHAPEDDPHLMELSKGQLTNPELIRAFPDDNRTFEQKLVDFFNPLSNSTHPYDHTKEYDIFGREILTVKDANGSISKIALDENLSHFAQEHNLTNENISEIAQFVDNMRLEKYLVEHHPNYANLEIANHETMDEFLGRLHDQSEAAIKAEVEAEHDIDDSSNNDSNVEDFDIPDFEY